MEKVIHYCWFGGNELTDEAKKCIESWKHFCPDYKIIEWNESNYDVSKCKYIQEAYDNKKWAFVSDFARFDILYNYGGLYFDTDVELISCIDDLVVAGPFMGLENAKEQDGFQINPGLGLYAMKNMEIYKRIIDHYSSISFKREDGTLDLTTVGEHISSILGIDKKIDNDNIIYLNDLIIYPTEYFAPLNYYTGDLNITSNTRSIHHYSESWVSPIDKMIKKIEKINVIIIGHRYGKIITKIIVMPIYIVRKIKEIGIKSTLKYSFYKIKEVFDNEQ